MCVCRSGTHARTLYLFPLSVTTLHTKVMNAAVQSATAIVWIFFIFKIQRLRSFNSPHTARCQCNSRLFWFYKSDLPTGFRSVSVYAGPASNKAPNPTRQWRFCNRLFPWPENLHPLLHCPRKRSLLSFLPATARNLSCFQVTISGSCFEFPNPRQISNCVILLIRSLSLSSSFF